MGIIVRRQAELLAEAFEDIGDSMLRAQIFDLTLVLANLTKHSETCGHTLADQEGRILSVDSGYCEIVCRERPGLLSMGVRELTHPADLHRGDALVRKLIACDEPFTIIKRYVREDRSAIWVKNQVALMKDGRGPDCIMISSTPLIVPPANDLYPSAAM